MARDLTAEPALPANNIQADILVGLLKRHEHLMFFRIVDVVKFKKFLKTLHVTSLQEGLAQRAAVDQHEGSLLPSPGLNIAFTFSGLQKLGVAGLPGPASLQQFRDGMHASQAALNDPPSANWKVLKPSANLHGVFILTGATHAETVDVMSLRLAPAGENGWELRHEEVGQVRPEPVKGHEHFGYADGVSQPGVRGTVGPGIALTPTVSGAEDSQGQKGQDLLWPGEFVFGYPGQDADANSFETKGQVADPPIPFMKDGAFLIFRRLAQKVPEFNHSVKSAALSISNGSNPINPDLLGAQLVGRWKSGAPLELAPTQDDLSKADDTEDVNNFEFGDDRLGLKCPWAAHIRKAYPRDDVPGNTSPNDEDTSRSCGSIHAISSHASSRDRVRSRSDRAGSVGRSIGGR